MTVSAGIAPEKLDRLPPRILPLLYLGTAHVSLALACFLVAWSPRAVAGFFYHSWMVAIVHLVTLGWITLSILGTIYIVGPVALQMPLPARRGDYIAYALALIGIVGMVAHFWIQEFGGMAWSAATVTSGVLYVAGRLVGGLRRSNVPAAVKLHITFACFNLLLAASAGILLGFDKVYHFLPGFVLSNVFAHAHLAAIGWATMMVVGVGYRLLPMTLPSKTPSGPTLFASAVLIEAGVLGLFVSLLARSHWAQVAGVVIVGGLGCFAAHVVQMLHAPRPKPVGSPKVDFAILHASAAAVSLMAASTLGLTLLFAPSSDWTLRAATAYGVFGLLGFLAQMVVAMETRLLPLFAWYWAFAGTGFRGPIAPPLAMHDRTLQAIVFAAWALGVPAIAAGFFFNAVPLLAGGAWSLLAGVLVGMVDHAFVLAHAFAVPARSTTNISVTPPLPRSA
jgi:hypothetical protein